MAKVDQTQPWGSPREEIKINQKIKWNKVRFYVLYALQAFQKGIAKSPPHQLKAPPSESECSSEQFLSRFKYTVCSEMGVAFGLHPPSWMQNKRTWLMRRSSAKSAGSLLNVDIPDITLAKWHTTARAFPVPDLQVPLNARATEQVVAFCDDNLQKSLTASNK